MSIPHLTFLENQTRMTNPALNPSPVQRLLSLDVLRGITIAFMIMVNNNGGSGAWGFMNHAQWNGLTPTDLVFPTFVFVVGASIVFAFQARLKRGATRAQLAIHTLQRAVILFLLGIVVNSFPFFELPHMRFYGVLQRIAVCYLVVGLFYLWDQRVWTKVAALVFALVGYWVLLRFVPVPGAGMPGRDIPFMDKGMNLVSWLDRLLMPHHLYLEWGGPDPHNLRDPEGLLSDLPAIGTALLGLLTGLWLRSARAVKQKAVGLAAAAVTCLALGYLWSLSFPLNKNLWTSSFVLVAAGWSLVVFTLAFWVVEQWGWGKGRSSGLVYPWLVLGSNAITAYMFSELVPSGLDHIHFLSNGKQTSPLAWLGDHVFIHIPDPGLAAFAYSVFTLAYCFIPVWIMYRKKIFVKV
ncbi:MAG TPA: heparan-alpha-glucosaminide N-acetyltransferase domain-containing protein [Terracidiphilus sp.]|nr:heparan-alpha-glucosaminide N-acetyltransferase domain-containing protein [Terracidiphilus sp.]